MSRILITGADGYLGSRVVTTCLAQGRPVTAMVHARNQTELRRRSHALSRRLRGDLKVVGGDLSDRQTLDALEPARISGIVHAAAATRFDVDRDTASQVNVAGTETVAAFANRCPRLDAFVMLGSLYAAGLLEGRIDEGPLDPPGFANHYEWSKWRAEKQLQDRYTGLPWTVLRVATIVADDAAGTCVQFNVVHDTLRLLYQGLLSVLPGQTSVPVYLITADVVAEAVVRLLGAPPANRFVHACCPAESNPTLGELLGAAMESFDQCPDFRRRRVQPPPFCDKEAFEWLTDGLRRHGGGLSEQVVGSLAPFAPQLYMHKRFEARRLPQLLGRSVPGITALLPRVCRQMLLGGALGCMAARRRPREISLGDRR